MSTGVSTRQVVGGLAMMVIPASLVMLDADFRRLQTWIILSPFLIALFFYFFIFGHNSHVRCGIGKLPIKSKETDTTEDPPSSNRE